VSEQEAVAKEIWKRRIDFDTLLFRSAQYVYTNFHTIYTDQE
jgi:hypothetical protein